MHIVPPYSIKTPKHSNLHISNDNIQSSTNTIKKKKKKKKKKTTLYKSNTQPKKPNLFLALLFTKPTIGLSTDLVSFRPLFES
jgi:azurin